MQRLVLSTATVVALITGYAHAAAAADACSVLTKDVATAALGEAVGAPKAAGNAQVSGCEYSGSGFTGSICRCGR